MLSMGLNSTMVRLQPVIPRMPRGNWNRSQFHYGSITTKVIQYTFSLLNVSLNSTMVRLQQMKTMKSWLTLLMSQFHYGSITTPMLGLKVTAQRLSQFHYGSITT